jgi:RNase P subunit RPR2
MYGFKLQCKNCNSYKTKVEKIQTGWDGEFRITIICNKCGQEAEYIDNLKRLNEYKINDIFQYPLR